MNNFSSNIFQTTLQFWRKWAQMMSSAQVWGRMPYDTENSNLKWNWRKAMEGQSRTFLRDIQTHACIDEIWYLVPDSNQAYLLHFTPCLSQKPLLTPRCLRIIIFCNKRPSGWRLISCVICVPKYRTSHTITHTALNGFTLQSLQNQFPIP
jgi:hypothetical protein